MSKPLERKMKRIIKEPEFKRCSCNSCGCIFEYQNNDISDNYVTCPACEGKCYITNTWFPLKKLDYDLKPESYMPNSQQSSVDIFDEKPAFDKDEIFKHVGMKNRMLIWNAIKENLSNDWMPIKVGDVEKYNLTMSHTSYVCGLKALYLMGYIDMKIVSGGEYKKRWAIRKLGCE